MNACIHGLKYSTFFVCMYVLYVFIYLCKIEIEFVLCILILMFDHIYINECKCVCNTLLLLPLLKKIILGYRAEHVAAGQDASRYCCTTRCLVLLANTSLIMVVLA